jgi:uncharacterized protein YraI
MKKLFILSMLIFAVSLYGRCYTEIVQGLNNYGDNFLSVRSGPSTRFPVKDTIHNGDKVSVCDYNGGWKLIYYGLSSCYLQNGEPRGNCQHGWAYGKYIRARY